MSYGNPIPPITDTRTYIGVEFEFREPLTRDKKWYTPNWVTDFRSRGFTHQHESLGGGVPGYESTMLALEAEYEPKFRELVTEIRDAGARVDATCGLHVHLDLRHRHTNVFPNFYDRFRMMKSRFQTPSIYSELAAMATGPRPCMGDPLYDRHKHTLEVRFMNSNFDIDHVVRYINRLIEIANQPFLLPTTPAVVEGVRNAA